jgi:sugar lactone lactonase YvrE
MTDVEVVGRERFELGECPIWDRAADRLLWVDILPGVVWTRTRDGEAQVLHRMGQPIGCVAPTVDGGVVLGARDGVVVLDADGAETWLVRAGERGVDSGFLAGERFNDGKCDHQGRLWVGSVNRVFGAGPGALYRVEPDGAIEKMRPEVVFSNGLDWSPDGETFYHIDTLRYTMEAFDFDADSGSISNMREHIAFDREGGYPDGMAVDEVGGLWVARYGGACIERYHPDGTFDMRIAVPANQPTSLTFGAEGTSELWITTAAQEIAEDDPRRLPDDGAMLRTSVGFRGAPTGRFGGIDDAAG